MFLVGLTGGIGTGKSTVSKMFQEFGVPVVDADVLARKVVEPGSAGWRAVRDVFGADVFLPDGQLDRPVLAKLIFNDPEKRRRLNGITHGRIQRLMMWQTLKLFLQGHQFVILDLPLLFESGVAVDFMEKIIVVSCEDDVQLSRLMLRSGESAADCRRRIDSQMPLRRKVQLADLVLENSGRLEETRGQVLAVLDLLSRSRAQWKVRAALLLLLAAATTLLVWLVSLRLNRNKAAQ